MLKRVKYILNETWTHRSEVTCIYVCQLVFGLTIGYLAYSTLNEHIGQSMVLDQLASGFDRTVFMDMVNSNDNLFSTISIWSMVLIPVYLILSIGLQGGLLYNIKKGEIGIQSQLNNGINFLLPFIGFAIITLVVILLFIVILGFPFIALVGDPLTTFSSEKPFLISLVGLVFLFSIILISIWAFNISARYAFINGSSFWAALMSGFSFIKKHVLRVILIGYLLVGLHLLLAVSYYLIMGDRGAQSWVIIIFGILIQQLFSFFRVYIRSLGYIAINQLDDR